MDHSPVTITAAAVNPNHTAGMFLATAERWPDRPATRVRIGTDPDQWQVASYAELQQSAIAIARGLIAAGVGRGDRVGLFAPNCPQWTQVDLACALAGAILVPIYATSTPDQIRHITTDSGLSLMVVGGQGELDRVLLGRELQGADWPVVSMTEVIADPDARVSLLAQLGVDVPELNAELASRLSQASADDLSAIVYTSGTTGDPKGVMLTHGSLVSQSRAVTDLFPITEQDHSLSFLPLSHALERAWQFVLLSKGCMNTYVANPRTVAEQLVAARPTMLVSVPKLYETVYRVAHEKVASSAAKRKIFAWAFQVGGRMQRALRKGKQPSWVWRSQLGMADKLVLSSVREAMGGPKTVLACGGAPLRPAIEEFFSAAGIPISSGYGLTEASPLVSFNSPTDFRVGSVGKVMAGGELAIGLDSEIFYRGPNVMAGYWNNPEATAVDLADGWLHTGDAGYVDNDGYLWITDRIKDIIVTIGGKNVAPQPIEGLVLADPLFEHAVLIGEGRPSLTMLVRPSLPGLEEIRESLHLPEMHPSELLKRPEITAELKRRAGLLTEKLPSHEQIRDLRASLEEFTMENGLLTPTLKVKRREVEAKFSELIEEMYAKIAEFRGKREDAAAGKDGGKQPSEPPSSDGH